MSSHCLACRRLNPNAAKFCYFDGVPLPGSGSEGPIAVGSRPFMAPFVFPNGRSCRTFDELVRACEDEWQQAGDMLREGYFEGFLGGLGRADLALAARLAAREDDRERALDEFISQLPGTRTPPRLHAEPRDINLGHLLDTRARTLTLRVANQGGGLLGGTVRSEVPWLALGEGAGVAEKHFSCRGELEVPIQVKPIALHAGKPQEGRLVIEAGNDTLVVLIRAGRDVLPFAQGKLAGATTPRQLAALARDHHRDAAPLFEAGEVARWYERNGWTYPVQGPAASGVAAVQQYFEALGLTRPPKVQISQTAVELIGAPGGSVEHFLFVETAENRPVYARAVSETHWLEIGKVRHQGASARIHLRVPRVPALPGQRLSGKAVVIANGNKRFEVQVSLKVDGVASSSRRPPPVRNNNSRSATETVQAPVATVREIPMPSAPPTPIEVVSVAPIPLYPEEPVPLEEVFEDPAPPPPPPPPGPTSAAPLPVPTEVIRAVPPARRGLAVHLIAPTLILLALLGAVVHDLLLPSGGGAGYIDPTAVVELRFHDGKHPDDFKGPPGTMSFGLLLRDSSAPKRLKRLMYDELGRTNNVCVQLDGQEFLVGHPELVVTHRGALPTRVKAGVGRWVEPRTPLGKGRDGRMRSGARSVWRIGPLGKDVEVDVIQTVEIVPGEQSERLDTALIRYTLHNRGRRPHDVGLRFLLDTFIGNNDGVPFTIPGQPGLCSTKRLFGRPADVPDYVQALEKESLLAPGTVAHIQLRVPGPLEPPTRVLLGGYPDAPLRDLYPEARGWFTTWNVPLIDIREMVQRRDRLIDKVRDPVPDSALTLYWDATKLEPGEKREVGFTYGLGEVASGEGQGKLLLTVGGRTVRDGEFSVTALRADPVAGEKLTLLLPSDEALRLLSPAEQAVPAVAAGSTRRISTVTWRLRATQTGQFPLAVRSSAGFRQKQTVRIHPPRGTSGLTITQRGVPCR